MVLKIVAIAVLVAGWLLARARGGSAPQRPRTQLGVDLAPIGAALTPVMFSYGGWQTASFVAGEMRNPRRDLARGLLARRRRRDPPLHRGRLRLRRCARAGRTWPHRRRRRAT